MEVNIKTWKGGTFEFYRYFLLGFVSLYRPLIPMQKKYIKLENETRATLERVIVMANFHNQKWYFFHKLP